MTWLSVATASSPASGLKQSELMCCGSGADRVAISRPVAGSMSWTVQADRAMASIRLSREKARGPGIGSKRSRGITKPGAQEPTCQKRYLSCSLVTSHCPSGLNATPHDPGAAFRNCQTGAVVLEVKSQTLAPSVNLQLPPAAQRPVGLRAMFCCRGAQLSST